jgi:hypothetical protein
MSGEVLSITQTDFAPALAVLMPAQSFSIPTGAED